MSDKQAMLRKVRASHEKGHDMPKIWDITGSPDLFTAVRQWERASGMRAKSFGFDTEPGVVVVKWCWPVEARAAAR